MTSEKVLLEILNNHFTGIVEEMGYVIHRASFTVFVKETWDFDSALVTREGEIFCYPLNIGVTNMLAMDMGPAIRCIESYEPGDVIVTNDPNATRGMCTHLPDIMLFKPLFFEGRLLCFAWCFIHASDVGGLVPGSIAPSAYDRFQEGLTIPPTKLYKAGKLNKELLDLMLANFRIPEQNWGDIKALLAALSICERRMGQLVSRYGVDTVERLIHGLLDYAERGAKEIFEAVPDGVYEFSDYVEADIVTPYYLRIKLRLVVKGSEVLLDFTGTDTPVRAAMNLPTHGQPNQWVVLGLVNYLRTSNRALPMNRGLLRSVRVQIPTGTLLNPTSFAATGVRHTTGYRVSDVVLGALSQAVWQQIPAAGAGQASIVLFSHFDHNTGGYKVNVLQPMAGGSGARPNKDGIDGVHFSSGSLRNVPTESIELEAPIIVNYYMLVDEAAAGQYRGGSPVTFEFQCLTPNAIVTARGMDRFRLRPYGRKGAEPGSLGKTLFNPGTKDEADIGKIDILKLEPGDVIRITSPAGAGYGSPVDRDVESVLKDVEDGFVTPEEARETYGVILNENQMDEAATEARRDQLRKQRSEEEFIFGAERAEYEECLPESIQDTVAELLTEYPIASRQFLREGLYRNIETESALRSQPKDVAIRRLREMVEVIKTPPARTPVTAHK